MNINNRLRTTVYEMDIRIHTADVSHEADEVKHHENYLKPILYIYIPTIFFYQKYIHMDENYFILCSLMTVFNIHVFNIFCLTEPN